MKLTATLSHWMLYGVLLTQICKCSQILIDILLELISILEICTILHFRTTTAFSNKLCCFHLCSKQSKQPCLHKMYSERLRVVSTTS